MTDKASPLVRLRSKKKKVPSRCDGRRDHCRQLRWSGSGGHLGWCRFGQGDHDHDPWGVTWQMGHWKFDTASEAAYPTLLAQRAATCLVVHAKSKGWSLASRPKLHDLVTASLNKQSKAIDSRISSSCLPAKQ